MKSKQDEAARKAIQAAKTLIGILEYEGAKVKIQEAINISPNTYTQSGQGMITVCEVLHLCQTHEHSTRTRTWPYTLLQIPISSTETEVKSRYKKLMADMNALEHVRSDHRIKGAVAAMKELDVAMSMYYTDKGSEKKRKASTSSSDKDNAASDGNGAGAGAGGDTDDDEDPFAAQLLTPEFKKLRKQIFATSPQQPHFSSLPKCSASVRQGIRLGFDMVLVKLTQMLQSFGSDQMLSHEEEETIKEDLSALEEMGYGTMKLRERFELLVRLKALAVEDESYEWKRKNLEDKIKAEMVELEKVQCKVAGLKKENEVVKAQHCSFKKEVASLKAKLSEGDLMHGVKLEVKGERF